jgi:hypothetical protein
MGTSEHGIDVGSLGELEPFNSLNAMNALYPDTGGGLYHFYDTFNPWPGRPRISMTTIA